MVETEPSACRRRSCFNQSIKIAQRQQAKSLELRAVISLARLYQESGQTGNRRQSPRRDLRTFTEGFDTADLRDAKALLDELSPSGAVT